ncbi:hypothetical protein IWW52_004772, partial [Coemansia sp. RSA 2704]
MNPQQLHVYRHLLREINHRFTSVNGNRAWASQLRQQWVAASRDTDGNTRAAQNVLSYLSNNRKYQDLLAEFNPKLPETDRIEKTARRV